MEPRWQFLRTTTPQRSVEERLDTLEHAVATLMSLPGQVGTLRSELHAARVEMRSLHREGRPFHDLVLSNCTKLDKQENELEKSVEETRRLMLALHEQVMARLDAFGDAQK